jgi:FMN phosphatase YigB (HAD superfamily)
MEKCIAFDIGRVLVKVDFTRFLKVYSDLSLDQLDDPMAFLFDLHGQQDVGLTTIARAAKERFGIPSHQTDALLEAWNEAIVPEPEMMGLIHALHKDGWNIALLSNMGLEHAAYLRENLPDLFEMCEAHLSCDVGARKPSKLFFQSFLMDHPKYRGCIFVDDLEQNRKVANFYGFRSYDFNMENGDLERLDDLKKAIADYKEEIRIYGIAQDFCGGSGI